MPASSTSPVTAAVGDLIVEAALLGAAVGMVVQATLEWLQPMSSTSGSMAWAQASVLVGLDVALAVIAARAYTEQSARQAPVTVLAVASVMLAVVHAGVAHQLAGGGGGRFLELVTVIPLFTFAAAAGLDALVDQPDRLVYEGRSFSPTHAIVVGTAILVGPVVLGLQVMSDIDVSAAVASGAIATALVLACHVVVLLRERATGEHRATHDGLTALPNRVLFMDRLERSIAHARRAGTPVGVLYLDLDRFKDVNDSLGHEAGDHLLAVTARRLVECAREEDTVSRLSGDEFAVLLPHLRDADDVMVVAERVAEALMEPVTIDGQRVRSPASVGMATYPRDGRDAAELMNAADAAMYRAKAHGGAGVGMFSTDVYQEVASRLEIESALYEGLERGEVILHYQPIIDALDGQIVGAEALVRWEHPTRGMVSPAEFIPVAEQSDLIVDLGRHVLDLACNELARWRAAGIGDRFVTVNVSGRQFQHDLVSDVTAALRESGVDPKNLVLEITESAAIDDLTGVADRLRELRKIGVRAAIDDFGTGYCGLQYLGDLPVSTLKLDRSFVQTMTPSSAAIVAATIAMAHSLGMTLVAEGVETEEQRKFLERSGCDRLQGFHLGRPMPAADLRELLEAQRVVRPIVQLDQPRWEGAAAR